MFSFKVLGVWIAHSLCEGMGDACLSLCDSMLKQKKIIWYNKIYSLKLSQEKKNGDMV